MPDELGLPEAAEHRLMLLGRLSGGVIHDFNNLLTVILFGLDMAGRSKNLDPDAAEALAQARAAALRGAGLTRRLLGLGRSRPQAVKALDLGEAIRGLARLLERMLPVHVGLELQLDPSPCWVRAEQALVDQAVMNLALNAAQAQPEGGRVLLATYRRTLEGDASRSLGLGGPGDYVRLEVCDNGPGVQDEALPRIFDPFFTTKPGGTGLGLPVVRELAQQAGGAVQVQNLSGGGACFALWLPLVSAPPPPAPFKEDPAAQARTGERILVVEDQPALADSLQQWLGSVGYRVKAVRNPRQALALAGEDWQLLVCDLALPQMDGPSLVRRLRLRRPGLPVLYVSGYGSGSFFGSEEAVYFLNKPFSPDEFLAEVRRALEGMDGKSGIL